MKTIKLRALRPLERRGRTIHPGEHFPVDASDAPALVKAGDAAYRPGDEPKAKSAKPEAKGEP